MTLTLASDGDLVQHSHYQPYGDAANIQPSRIQPYGFSGKERDDSGLMYFEARYYDPVSGRFISPDPLFAEQMDKCLGSVIECNLYQYTGNNPVMYVDIKGLAKAKTWQNAEHLSMKRLEKSGHKILFGIKTGNRVQATRDGYLFQRNFDVVSEKDGVYYLTEVKFREKVKNQKSNVRKAERALNNGINPASKPMAAYNIYKAGTTIAQLFHDATLSSDIQLSGKTLPDIGLLSEIDGEVRIRWELWSSDKDDSIIDITGKKARSN